MNTPNQARDTGTSKVPETLEVCSWANPTQVLAQREKPDWSDGMEIYDIWPSYKEASQSAWKRFPEIFAAGRVIVTSVPLEPGLIPKVRACLSAMKKAMIFLRNTERHPISLPACEVLLFHSSDKPSIQPATDMLAERLARKNLRCAVVGGNYKMVICEREGSSPAGITIKLVPDYAQWMRQAQSHWHALWLLGRSLTVTSVLFVLLMCKGKYSCRIFFSNPFEIWYQLLMSAHRLAVCRRILHQLQPKFLLVNGEHVPVGAELVLSSASDKTYKVWFNNEIPGAFSGPIISHEVWVWNKTVINSLRNILLDHEEPRFSVVGSAEVSVALDQLRTHDENERKLRCLTEDKPVFLFLSDYDASAVRRTERIAEEANRWLACVARRCPNWHFIFKTRPAHHDKVVPGWEYFDGLNNISISRGGISYRQFLGWDNLIAVGGYNSSGLYVAAGVGKIACRFLVSSRQRAYPVLDEVSVPIHSPDDLAKLLYDLEKKIDAIGLKNYSFEEDPRFPYRGYTLDRMESLCLEHLRGND